MRKRKLEITCYLIIFSWLGFFELNRHNWDFSLGQPINPILFYIISLAWLGTIIFVLCLFNYLAAKNKDYGWLGSGVAFVLSGLTLFFAWSAYGGWAIYVVWSALISLFLFGLNGFWITYKLQSRNRI